MSNYKLKCINCGEDYIGTSSTQKFCPHCSKITLTCQICGKEFEVKRSKFLQNPNTTFTCSRKCSSTYASRVAHENKIEKYCDKCGEITKHHQNGQCMKCIALENAKGWEEWIHSEECNKLRRQNGENWRNSDAGREHGRKILKDYYESNEGKEFRQQQLDKIHERMSNGELANSPDALKRRRDLMHENYYKIINKLYASANIPNLVFDDTPLKSIKYNSFDKYKNVKGVWSIWDRDSKICLDVAETINIGKEMNLFLRKYLARKLDKYDKLAEYKNLEFRIVKLNIEDKEERQLYEAVYAIKNKAKYWNPAPCQNIDV